jgi:hypothetical protein
VSSVMVEHQQHKAVEVSEDWAGSGASEPLKGCSVLTWVAVVFALGMAPAAHSSGGEQSSNKLAWTS